MYIFVTQTNVSTVYSFKGLSIEIYLNEQLFVHMSACKDAVPGQLHHQLLQVASGVGAALVEQRLVLLRRKNRFEL